MAKMIRFGTVALAMVVFGMTAAVVAQDQETKPAPNAIAAPQKQAQIPLKLQLVLSRHQGDRKISSVPFVLWLTTNEPRTSLRMMARLSEMPGGGSAWRDVGTNIDCNATTGNENGVYKFNVTVNDTSVVSIDGQRTGFSVPSAVSQPILRTFISTFNILLRDGQTAQYTSATDSVSGEVLKIDATLNVLK